MTNNDDVLKHWASFVRQWWDRKNLPPFIFLLGVWRFMTPLFSCPPPPFVRFSISFACGQIRAICRPAGFPDGGGEISMADRLRPFMQQLPPFSSHSPVRYQLLLLPLFPGPGYHFQYSHQIECSWPRHVEQRLHFKTCPCQLPCPFSCNRSATPIFTVGGGGLGLGTRTAEATL